MTAAPAQPLHLVGLTDPFSLKRQIDLQMPAGGTVAELLTAAGAPLPDGVTAKVFIGDWEIPRPLWHRVRPKPGHIVTLRIVPGFGGGGGGGGKKNPLRTVLTIVVMIAAVALAAYLGPIVGGVLGPMLGVAAETATIIGGGLVSGVVGIVGNLVISAVTPPPSRPSMPGLRSGGFGGSTAASPTYSLVGASNDYRAYQPIPALIGRHKITPPYAAKWFTRVSGNDHVLYLLFLVGHGPLVLSNHKLGDTDADQYEEVEIEVRQGYPNDTPPELFPYDVEARRFQIQLTTEDGWRRLTAPSEADELSIEITCPRLANFWASGRRTEWTVELAIRWSPAGAETWTDEPNLVITDNQTNAVRREWTWAVDRGLYDIEVKRITEDSTSDQIQDESYWTAIQVFRHEPPVALPGLCLVAMKMLATGNLSGQHPPYSCVATRITPDWDTDTQSWIERETRSPVAAYRWVLQGGATHRPAADADIDLDALAAWAEDCTDEGWTCDIVYDFASTFREVLRDISATGRARPYRPDSRWSVIRDRPQTAPVAVITPRNSWGFEAKQNYVDHPHGLVVWFVNEEKDWQRDFVVVYADGYDAATATRFEELDLFGITAPDLAWKVGRFNLAVARLRPAEYRVAQDVENWTCLPGDWVDLAHDVISVGLGYGRIRQVVLDPGASAGEEIVGLELDEELTQEAGKSYAVVITSGAEAARTLTLTTVPGTSRFVTFATPQPLTLVDDDVIGEGWMVTFGEAGSETIPCIVRDVLPGSDLSARLVLQDLAPAIHTADQGPIPAYDSGLTKGAAAYAARPAAPVIAGIVSDESVLLPAPGGGWQPQMIVQLQPRAGDTVPIARTQAQIRAVDGRDWTWLPDLPGDATEVSTTAVVQGDAYTVRVRVVTGATAQHPGDLTSPWAVATHTVIGKTTLPPRVPSLTRRNNEAVWDYPERPRDFAGFEVRDAAGVTRVWDAAEPSHIGYATSPFDLSPLLGGGVRSILVKAVDTDGNVSAEAATLVVNLGDPAVTNVVEETPLHPTFPGTVAGASLISGELVADNVAAWWQGVDGTVLWSGVDANQIWGVSQHQAVSYVWDYEPSEAAQLTLVHDFDAPQGWSLQYAETLRGEMWSGDDAATWWSGTDAAARWQGDAGTWLAWPGALDVDLPVRFRLTLTGGPLPGVVRALTLCLDVEDVDEEVLNLAIPAEGIRLPLTKSYRWIKSVTITQQDDGGDAVKIVKADNSNTGPLIRALDADGAGTTGSADFTIKGARAAA